MNAQQLTIGAYVTTGAGIALMLFNAAFPVLLPATTAWSEEEAQEYSAAAANLHYMVHAAGPDDHGHSHGEAGDQPGPADLAAAKERWQKQEARFNSAMSRRNILRATLKWSGILLAVAGAGLVVYLRFGLGTGSE